MSNKEKMIKAAEIACDAGIDELDLTLSEVESSVEHIASIMPAGVNA